MSATQESRGRFPFKDTLTSSEMGKASRDASVQLVARLLGVPQFVSALNSSELDVSAGRGARDNIVELEFEGTGYNGDEYAYKFLLRTCSEIFISCT